MPDPERLEGLIGKDRNESRLAVNTALRMFPEIDGLPQYEPHSKVNFGWGSSNMSEAAVEQYGFRPLVPVGEDVESSQIGSIIPEINIHFVNGDELKGYVNEYRSNNGMVDQPEEDSYIAHLPFRDSSKNSLELIIGSTESKISYEDRVQKQISDIEKIISGVVESSGSFQELDEATLDEIREGMLENTDQTLMHSLTEDIDEILVKALTVSVDYSVTRQTLANQALSRITPYIGIGIPYSAGAVDLLQDEKLGNLTIVGLSIGALVLGLLNSAGNRFNMQIVLDQLEAKKIKSHVRLISDDVHETYCAGHFAAKMNKALGEDSDKQS